MKREVGERERKKKPSINVEGVSKNIGNIKFKYGRTPSPRACIIPLFTDRCPRSHPGPLAANVATSDE